jgi:hypothetical protein
MDTFCRGPCVDWVKCNQSETSMFRILPLLLLPLLAACDEAAMNAALGIEPEAPVYPPEVIAALPPGVPPSVAFLGPDGCWAVSIEVTVPQQGYAMRDANGQPVCDAAAVAAAAANAPVEQAVPTEIIPAG